MKEKIIILNIDDYKTREEIFFHIEEELGFSHASIRNLDSLRDCLSEVFYSVIFIIISKQNNTLSDPILNVCNALELISKENNYIKVVII